MYEMVAPTREICQHLDNSRHHRLSDRAMASVDGERSHFNNSVFAVAVRNPTVQPPNTLWTLTAATGCSLKPLTQSHLQKYMRFSLIHPASYSMGTGWSFMEVKWPERAADNSPPSTPISIHGMDRENFNFNFWPNKRHFLRSNSGFVFRLYCSYKVRQADCINLSFVF